MNNLENELDNKLKLTMGYRDSVDECCNNCEYSYPVGMELRCHYNRACHLIVEKTGYCKYWLSEEKLDKAPPVPEQNPPKQIGPDIEPGGELLKS